MIKAGSFVTIAILLCITAEMARCQSGVVEELEIRGNRTVSRDEILKHIKTTVGEPFSRKQADEDMENVLKIGVFDKAASRLVIESGLRGGVALRFILKEKAVK